MNTLKDNVNLMKDILAIVILSPILLALIILYAFGYIVITPIAWAVSRFVEGGV